MIRDATKKYVNESQSTQFSRNKEFKLFKNFFNEFGQQQNKRCSSYIATPHNRAALFCLFLTIFRNNYMARAIRTLLRANSVQVCYSPLSANRLLMCYSPLRAISLQRFYQPFKAILKKLISVESMKQCFRSIL